MKRAETYPTLAFETQHAWEMWLEQHHNDAKGVWIKLAKKASGLPSMSRAEAVDVALCYGWIDGQADSCDTQYWLQKFTPRTPRSRWSQINREKVGDLQAAGRMRAAGIRQVELAQADGRWQAAYAGQRKATVPDDLLRELQQNQKAYAFFNTLSKSHRYTIQLSIETVKKAETRAARIQKIVEMLANNEKSPA